MKRADGVHHATLLDSAEKLRISVEHDAYDWLNSAEIVAVVQVNRLSRMVTRAELMKDGFADGVMAALRQDSAET